MTRYHLHGDLKEGTVDLYYCRCCDYFFPADHFLEHDHPDESYPRAKHPRNHTKYRQEVNMWISWNYHGIAQANNFDRPINPPNLFAEICRAKWRSLRFI